MADVVVVLPGALEGVDAGVVAVAVVGAAVDAAVGVAVDGVGTEVGCVGCFAAGTMGGV